MHDWVDWEFNILTWWNKWLKLWCSFIIIDVMQVTEDKTAWKCYINKTAGGRIKYHIIYKIIRIRNVQGSSYYHNHKPEMQNMSISTN